MGCFLLAAYSLVWCAFFLQDAPMVPLQRTTAVYDGLQTYNREYSVGHSDAQFCSDGHDQGVCHFSARRSMKQKSRMMFYTVSLWKYITNRYAHSLILNRDHVTQRNAQAIPYNSVGIGSNVQQAMLSRSHFEAINEVVGQINVLSRCVLAESAEGIPLFQQSLTLVMDHRRTRQRRFKK